MRSGDARDGRAGAASSTPTAQAPECPKSSESSHVAVHALLPAVVPSALWFVSFHLLPSGSSQQLAVAVT